MKFRTTMMTGTMAIVAFLSGSAMGQNPQTDDSTANVDLDEIKVLSTRVPLSQKQTPQQVTIIDRNEIMLSPANTVDGLLKAAAKIDVRQRGSGVQTDISLRGGSFDQVTILLNGINITSPHTGHLSADFPVSKEDIKRIEILDGPSARVFSTQSFCGTVNIVTVDDDPQKNGYSTSAKGSVSLFGGDHGLWGSNANLTLSHNAGFNSKGNPNRLIHNLSIGYLSDDGATDNSAYNLKRAFYRASYRSKKTIADFQAGYSYKPFEANTFYGGGASKDQWESNEHFLVSVNADIQAGAVHISPVFSADRRYDHYQWHKDSHAGENFHLSQVLSYGLNFWTKSRFGRSSIGAEVRSEEIYSTKLGEKLAPEKVEKLKGHDAENGIFYTNYADRNNIVLVAEHDFIFDKFTVALALPAIYNSSLDEKWRLCPGTDIAYNPNKRLKFFINVNSALRMPTYTDLYYSATNIQGTSDLKPERTIDYGLGAKYRQSGFSSELRLFASNKKDMIDWVIFADEADGKTYRSSNFKMHNFGGELDLVFLPKEIFDNSFLSRLDLQYCYIDAEASYEKEIIASEYAQEFLKHKIVLSSDFEIVKDLFFNLSYRYHYRIGENNPPYTLVDCGVKYIRNRFEIFTDVTNVFNEKYSDFSFIEQPGTRVVAGVKLKF